MTYCQSEFWSGILSRLVWLGVSPSPFLPLGHGARAASGARLKAPMLAHTYLLTAVWLATGTLSSKPLQEVRKSFLWRSVNFSKRFLAVVVLYPFFFSAAPQQSEICVKFSVFHTVFDVKFSVAHPNPGTRSTENFTKISHQISRQFWQRKTAENTPNLPLLDFQ